MQSKSRIVARHEPTGLYFSKTASLTANLFDVMTFEDESNAEQIIFHGIFRPRDPENYKYCKMVTTKEVH